MCQCRHLTFGGMSIADQMTSAGFLRAIELLPGSTEPRAESGLAPAIRAELQLQAHQIDFHPGVTFLLGPNGIGKSQLLEAIADESGFSTGGGSRNLQVSAPRSPLHGRLRMVRSIHKPHDSFFLRSDTIHSLAAKIDSSERQMPGLLDSYGGRSLQARSHGQKHLDIILNRMGPKGFYLLDEPDSGIGPAKLHTLMQHLLDLVALESQFVIATHDPRFAQLPGARILEFSTAGIHPVTWDSCRWARASQDPFIPRPTVTNSSSEIS